MIVGFVEVLVWGCGFQSLKPRSLNNYLDYLLGPLLSFR